MTEQDNLVNIFYQQKQSLTVALARETIPRDCLEEAKKLLGSPLIKVVTGPRRAGKSTLALQLLKDKLFAYMDCDDPDLLSYIEEHGSGVLPDKLREVYPNFEFLLIDEVQNIPRWELVVSKLSKQGIKLLITGSNANLLSQELGTHLTGRYQEIQLMPLSWGEYSSWYKDTRSFDDYLRQGGYPELLNSGIDTANYLSTLANSILLKDIVQRFKVRQATQLSQLWQALKGQFAQKFSISKLAHALHFRSKITLQNYLTYIENVYLLCELQRYNSKLKIQLKAPRKIYLIDTGFTSTLSLPFDANSRILENVIYLGLRRHCEANSQSLFYAITAENYEIDFIIRNETKTLALIQVCHTLDSPNTRDRELRALEQGQAEFVCDNLIVVSASSAPIKDRLSSAVRIRQYSAEVFLSATQACLEER